MISLAIMQPYFFPYIGYFQLLNRVDEFVVYDNIQYTKKGWINRNRILENGKASYISLSLKKDSYYLNINDRFLSENSKETLEKIKARIKNNYHHAPYFNEVFPIVTEILNYSEKSLFSFLYNSLNVLKRFLDIQTTLTISSSIHIDHDLKFQDKVIAISKQLGYDHYINSIGGKEIYSSDQFEKHGIVLNFLKTNHIEYEQLSPVFTPYLSIIDVLMFNGKMATMNLINNDYEII